MSAASTGAEGPAIEVVGLAKRYVTREVLRGVDLTVPRGIVFGYIGPNGAGKSTTVKILTGLIGSFQGSARVCGLDLRQAPQEVKARLGYVPENAQLFEQLTVAEHLRFVGRLHHLKEETIEQRGTAILEAFELRARRDSRLGSLSKGMRQKVLIASALLHDPEVLFLDEPLTGLDVNATLMVKELIRALADSGKTVFYCSHIMEVVERVSDRVAIIDDGRIVADGSVAQLRGAALDASLEAVFRRITKNTLADDDQVAARRVLAALRPQPPEVSA
ncbi:MAG: ABC transporter ATP-binding protein [Planctomycetota bacterium]